MSCPHLAPTTPGSDPCSSPEPQSEKKRLPLSSSSLESCSSPSKPSRRSKRLAAKTVDSSSSVYQQSGFCPAPEILLHIFSYFPQWQDTTSLLACLCVSKQWKELAAPFLYRHAWTRRVLARTALPQFKQTAVDWPRLCLLVLAGLKSSASACLGAPRLFYVEVPEANESVDEDEGAAWVNVDAIASKAMDRIEDGIRNHPNPEDPKWESILACTMDFRDFIRDAANLPHSSSSTTTLATVAELEGCAEGASSNTFPTIGNNYNNNSNNYNSGSSSSNGTAAAREPTTPTTSDGRFGFGSTPPPPLAPPLVSYAFARRRLAAGQDPARIPVLVKWSEKWDVGTYFVWADLSAGRGAVLLRCKPTDDGRVIVWDACTFGTCNKCHCRLPKIQSCAQCRIAQYCSRECQREDWFNVHKKECLSLAYTPVIPDGGSDFEM
ncbi:hypothetical protein SmJEL517_g04951 [Synchytrium microbalum]|uniref:MYND-type domain-containing protein n=1 Tax=Synchytrium microbalum TaxID=1806994 RepID=A0A507C2L2_9FUNG|nr:uncharacterized protein SmJEL517_g04951 [Synchytrium microbalum]TPX31775.1 hypothetical protein SmJEL517_g04951 [Synchytrium microbalum]